MKVIITSFSPTDNPNPATLVFDTVRIGFPTANIDCYWTGISPSVADKVKMLCKKNDIRFIIDTSLTTNDAVGHRVIHKEQGDIVLLDSDVIFWDKVEDIKSLHLLHGRLIPRHICQYTGLITQARLHPSLLFIRSVHVVRRMLYKSNSRFVPVNYCYPTTICENGKVIFYDSFTNLFQFFGGQAFSKDILDKYDHLFCSSFVDEVSKNSVELSNLKQIHEHIYKHPQDLKGKWKEQEMYFQKHLV